MATSPPNVRLHSQSGADSFDDAEFGESETPRIRPLGLRADDNSGASTSKDKQSGSSRFMSATSAAFTRVKGMTIRSGSSGRVLNPRSVTLVSSLLSPSRERRSDTTSGHHEERQGSNGPYSPESNSSKSGADNRGETNSTRSQQEVEQGGMGGKSNKQKLSVLFDDDESDTENRSEGGSASTNNDAATPRSKWASTLVASTLAREKTAGKTALRDRDDLLPRPRDAGNKVSLERACRRPRGPHQFYMSSMQQHVKLSWFFVRHHSLFRQPRDKKYSRNSKETCSKMIFCLLYNTLLLTQKQHTPKGRLMQGWEAQDKQTFFALVLWGAA